MTAAVLISLAGVVVLLAVGVVAYDVQLLGRTAAAVIVTLVVGVACFASLGLAAVALLRSSTVVESVTSGIIVLLAFISGILAVGADMPLCVERLALVFPLKHFVEAMTTAFDPFGSGAGFSPRPSGGHGRVECRRAGRGHPTVPLAAARGRRATRTA